MAKKTKLKTKQELIDDLDAGKTDTRVLVSAEPAKPEEEAVETPDLTIPDSFEKDLEEVRELEKADKEADIAKGKAPMHEHSACDHKFEFCPHCNVVYCEACRTEWGEQPSAQPSHFLPLDAQLAGTGTQPPQPIEDRSGISDPMTAEFE